MNDDAVQREIKAALGIFRGSGRKRDPSGENAIIAQVSTHAERADCNLPPRSGSLIEHQAARDAILFYGRQDAAHAVLNTASLLGEVAALRRQLRALTILVGVLVAGMLAVLVLGAWVLGLGR